MTKQEILEKIEPLFFQKSFKEISMQEIADTLEMKKASLYYHFPSKEALIWEVIEKSFQDYLYFVKIIIKKSSDDYKKSSICELIQRFISFPEKNKNIFSIISQNGFKENDQINALIETKQQIIFDMIQIYMLEQFEFSKTKTYLFLETLKDFWRKTNDFSQYQLKSEEVIEEIYDLFFK